MTESRINEILNLVGLDFEKLDNDYLISRDLLLCDDKYKSIKSKIPELRKYFSSSFLTSLQITAEEKQKWPLINLVRQLLKVHKYNMKPIRKSAGYTVDGKKKFARYFLIQNMSAIDNPN
tara:strand:+ start:321 stop:680 length:360 start_codon:yes stop_codon:yes gene_type:complete